MTKNNKKFISIKVTIDYQSYRALLNEAARQGLSLNDLCVQILTEYVDKNQKVDISSYPRGAGLSDIVQRLEKEEKS